MEDANLINQILLDRYGKTLDSRPKYRIIMNAISLRENRLEEVEVLGGIKVKAVLRDVQKYSYIPEGVWILEVFMEYDNPELLERQSYEPLWTFVDILGNSVQPNLRACILIVESHLRGAQEVMSEDEKREKAEREGYEMLGGDAGIADKLNAKEGIVIPSTFKES